LSRTLSLGALSLLLLALPFEPRRPTLPVAGLELTLLEAVAGAAAAVLLSANRDRVDALVRRPPLPLALLAAYVAVGALSAAVAPMNRVLAAKFVMRMAAAAVLALAVAAAPAEAPRRAAFALTAAGAAVAALSILEGGGVTALDPVLERFRAGPYWIGTSRRATAGSENPNLAAAMLVYGLVPAIGAAVLTRRPAALAAPAAALFGLGLLFTYSRGGLAAATAGLLALGLALAARDRAAARAPLMALLTLIAVAASFALARGPAAARLYSEGRAPSHAASYAPRETFLSLAPRESRPLAVTLTNAGRVRWNVATLNCSWRRAEPPLAVDWTATAHCPSTGVPPVAPGESVRVDAAIRAPGDEGRYVLVLDLVADGWIMSSAGVTPATVPAAVSRDPAAARPFTATVPAGAWRRDRGVLWRAALAMWRERPLLGIGPDNFRWAHAGYAGWPAHPHETLIPANNLFLEAAATTGTLGLLALLGAFVATARAAVRALRRAPPLSGDAVSAAVLLALTAAIAVHGAVDTLLGFTGHYLFLGIVVGAASSADPRDEPA
jgi:hypothetical protein